MNTPKQIISKSINVLPPKEQNTFNDNTSRNRTDSTFLTVSTDDVSFASNQIRKITQKFHLQNYYNKKPWDKDANNNIFLTSGKSNFMLINEVKNKLKTKKPLKELNTNMNSYIPNDQHDKIIEASHILKRYENRKDCKEPYIDIYTYKTQSKEICIKNMLIDLMNEERMKLNKHEQEISRALTLNQRDLDKDIALFDTFTNDVRIKSKEIENRLGRVMQENKHSIDRKKKHTQDHRVILDEMEKTLRQIITLKFYAVFVHTILGGGKKYIKSKLPDKLEIKDNREQELVEYTQQICDELGFLLDDEDDKECQRILSDPEEVMNIYEQCENNILKFIAQRDEFIKERNAIANNQKENIDDLLMKYNLHEEEYQGYLNEHNYLEQRINDIKEGMIFDEFFIDALNYICEIDALIVGPPLKMKEKLPKHKIINKVLERSNSCLEQVELNINKMIEELECYEEENSELFNKCVNKRKKDNKLKRYLQEKETIEEKLEERARRLNSKMGHVVIRGRGRYPEPIPLHILKNRKANKITITDNTDEFKMLEYH